MLNARDTLYDAANLYVPGSPDDEQNLRTAALHYAATVLHRSGEEKAARLLLMIASEVL